jgi:NlpC/P60 family putative phage cell wall peptidase
MITRMEIVEEARRWIGTPYVHQASCRGSGTDCLGLIRGVWRAVLGEEPEIVPAYTEDWSEPNREETVLGAAGRWLVHKPVGSSDIGDVLVFRMARTSVAKHLAITAMRDGIPTFIHAYSNHSVVESSLSVRGLARLRADLNSQRG